jgi:hypothetical protein
VQLSDQAMLGQSEIVRSAVGAPVVTEVRVSDPASVSTST